jgi:hypothetical protein
MPRGGEERARRAYFAESLGLAELEKPLTLAGRAGSGTLPDGRRLHLGVEELFRPSAKAHPASKGGALDGLAWRLDESNYAMRWDRELEPKRRFYGEDPFCHRVEFIEP